MKKRKVKPRKKQDQAPKPKASDLFDSGFHLVHAESGIEAEQ